MSRACAAVVALVVLLAGCTGDEDPPTPPRSSASETDAPTGPMVVTDLPKGPPPQLTFIGGGQLHWRGRTVATDLPARAGNPVVLGAYADRLVVTATTPQGLSAFWALDDTGHARRLGGTYATYYYRPELVESTGHLWVSLQVREAPLTIWQLDARTGRRIATYHDRVPQGLAADDQALVDAWARVAEVVLDGPDQRTADGSLVVSSRATWLGGDRWRERVRVRRASDDAELARFRFAFDHDGGIEAEVFEDRDHVLLLVTVGAETRRGGDQVIVRCSVAEGTCERATEIGGTMALGVDTTLFET